MSRLWDDWLTRPLALQGIVWIAILALLAGGLWAGVYQPAWRHQMALQAEQAQLLAHYQQLQHQWQKLRLTLSTSPAVLSQAPADMSPTPVAFPALDIARRHGMTPLRWQPASDSADHELRLSGDWQTIPALFDDLARYQMRPVSFSLYPVDTQLRLILRLESPRDEK